MRPFLALSFVVLSGCAAPQASPVAPPLPAASTSYFEGTSEVFVAPRAGGAAPVATMRAVIRRKLDPARGVIVEQVASEEGRGRPAREYLVTMAVSGSNFSMKERGGAFEGSGSLSGPAWAWTSWESRSTLPDGSTVHSRDLLSEQGLTVEKEVKSPRGAVVLVERFARIDRESYLRKRAELGITGAVDEDR
jgi:hypothetical protein